MEEIKNVIHSFLEPFVADENFQAAVLTGSYAQGNQNKYSDIDIFIISSDELNWRERGSRIISNYVIEYFINPPKIIFKELEEINFYGMATVLMIANSKELFDKTGIIKKMKEKASKVINNPVTPIGDFEVEMIKYYLNYYFNQLERAYENNYNEFLFLYYAYLEYVIYSYGKHKGIILPAKVKIYQYIFDVNYCLNKDLEKINDKKFLEILKKCMTNDKKEIMLKNITELKDYLLKSVGGSTLNGWKIRSEIK